MLLSGCSQGKPLADLKLALGACPAWTTNQGLAFLRTKIMSCVNLVFLTVDLYSCLHWLACNNLCAALDWWVKAVVQVLTRDVTYDARTKRQTNLQVMQLKIVSIFQEQSNWSEKQVLCVCVWEHKMSHKYRCLSTFPPRNTAAPATWPALPYARPLVSKKRRSQTWIRDICEAER